MLSVALVYRYGTGLCHSRYNSQEVGQKAAESIAATFSSPFLGDSALPQLQSGRLTTTALPGGGVFAYAHAAGGQHSSLMDSQVCCFVPMGRCCVQLIPVQESLSKCCQLNNNVACCLL